MAVALPPNLFILILINCIQVSDFVYCLKLGFKYVKVKVSFSVILSIMSNSHMPLGQMSVCQVSGF